MAIETELKFTVHDRSIFDRIILLDEIAGYRTIPRGIIRIRDTFFDTPDTRLLKEGVVFRLRITDTSSVLTYKTQKASNGSAYQRIEIESETDANVNDICSGNMPDIPPVEALREKIGTVTLSPSLRT